MEQVGSGARQKRKDAKPFYVNITVIRNCDFTWKDGERCMPTQSEVAQIRKSSVLGQYKKQVEFYRNMSEKMVMEKLEETFSYLRNKSYACKVFTSRPAGCISTSRIWDGKTIKRNTQGNSALYILEDEVTQMNDSSAYLDQPKSKHRHDKLTSLDQSQKVTNELSSLEIGARAISGQEEQPTSCGSHPRSCTSHRTSGSWLALKEFSRAETSGAENRALQGVTRLPQNQKTFSSTSTPQMNTSNDLAVASQRSHELCLVEAMETSQQFCSNKTATEDLNLWLADPHPSHGASRPDSPRPDTIEGILFQNTTLPSRPRAILTSETSEVYYSDGFSSDILTTNGNSVFDISLPLEDLLPYDDIPDDVKFDFTVGPKKVPAEIPGCEDYVMTDNNDQTGTSEIRDCQLPYQGSSLNSTEMSDSSADYVNTTSGISELGHNSLDDLSLHEDEHFDFSVTPKKVPLQGGALCRFSSSRTFPRNVQSAFAIFENLDTVEVKRFGEDSLIGEKIPPSKTPGWVTIFLQRADGTKLGETKIWYYDEDKEALQRITENPKLQAEFFRNFSEMLSNRNTITASDAEAQNSEICGSTEPVQMLCVLVYAAAEIGGQQFIEMIFNSSAGRVIYNRYKDSSALPEAIAREYGHEMTATFLEEITVRFSKEAGEGQSYPQTIDWSELVRAAEEAQKQPGLSTEEESSHLESTVVKDTGYLGDIDTSSNESCESGSSESEDNILWATSKEMNYLADQLSEIELAHEDQEFGIKKAALSQSLMCICETGHLNREQVNSTASKKVVLPTSEDSFIREAYGLKHLISLNRCDTSFFLGSEQESILCHLTSEYERLCLLFKHMKDSSLHSRTFAAEGGQFVEQVSQETQAVMIGASFGYVEDLLCTQSKREFVTTSDNRELAVQWNSTQGSTNHSTSSDLWVLTCLYRPSRIILFVYVADNSDVLPQKAYFDDGRYELSIQCWQWQRYYSSLFDVQNRLQEMRKISEQMSPEFGPTPLPTYSAKMLPQVQGKHMLRQPESCPTWLYTLMHQCCAYAPTERSPFIAVFDIHSSSRTLRAHLITTRPSQCNQGRYLPLNNCQSEDPCRVNDKTNHPSSNVNVTDHRSARKEELYEEHLQGDETTVVYIDKRLLPQERINNEEEPPLFSSHPPPKIFHGVSKGIDDAQNQVDVETSFICSPGHERMSQKKITGIYDNIASSLSVNRCLRKRSSESLAEGASLTSFNLTIHKNGENLYGVLRKSVGKGLSKSTPSIDLLGEGFANSTSSTAFTRRISDVNRYLGGDWGKVLSEGLAKSTSLTAFILTINGINEYLDGDWGKGLGEGLAKSTSLTTFTLKINTVGRCQDKDWGKGLGEGLAESTSLTAFTLTINSVGGYLGGDWGKDLGEGLAKSTSLTAFTLTINSVGGYLQEDWGKGVGEGLAKSTSLTAFTLTISSIGEYLQEDWGKGVGEGLAKSTSLTAFTLTINSVGGYLQGDQGKGLGESLAKSASLTDFTLTINSVGGYLGKGWGKGLGESLAKSTSLTAFTLKINSADGYPDRYWGKGLGKGLAKSTSLTAFSLTVNNNDGRYLGGDWGKGLGEGLAKSKSLTAFTLTINNIERCLAKDWGKGLGKGLAKSSSLTAFTLTINSVGGYLGGDWGKGLGEGLAKILSLTAFTLTINGVDRHLGGDWRKGWSEGVGKSASLTAFPLKTNSYDRDMCRTWGKGLGKGLAKSASLTAFTLTVNGVNIYLAGDWGEGLGECLAKSTSLTAFNLTINKVDRYLGGDWGKGLSEGLAKSTSLTAFTLSMNGVESHLCGNWREGLREVLAKSTSLTASTLTINGVNRNLGRDWGKGLGKGLVKSPSLDGVTLTGYQYDGEYMDVDGGWVKGQRSEWNGERSFSHNLWIDDSYFNLHEWLPPSDRSVFVREEYVTGSFKGIKTKKKGLTKEASRCTLM